VWASRCLGCSISPYSRTFRSHSVLPEGWPENSRKTLFCREKSDQYAAQENCVRRNMAERVKLNYLVGAYPASKKSAVGNLRDIV
jgi:hypothetical protein